MSSDELLGGGRSFAEFVLDYLIRKHGGAPGQMRLINQSAWNLIYTVEKFRAEFAQVKIFGLFLNETYEPRDLLFFLYARRAISREQNSFAYESRLAKRRSDAFRARSENPPQLASNSLKCGVTGRSLGRRSAAGGCGGGGASSSGGSSPVKKSFDADPPPNCVLSDNAILATFSKLRGDLLGGPQSLKRLSQDYYADSHSCTGHHKSWRPAPPKVRNGKSTPILPHDH